jgi:hypothetical protein
MPFTIFNIPRDRRFDFEIALQVDVFAAIEVKGGEGNSINISERPVWAKEFGIWSHLDGAIVNQPAAGARSIVNRLTNELVRREKLVDVVFFKDILCGTRTRPCPKYPGREAETGLLTAPDVFLFPQRRPIYSPDDPTRHEPAPPVHSLETLRLPKLILAGFQSKRTGESSKMRVGYFSGLRSVNWGGEIDIDRKIDGFERQLGPDR